MDLSAQKQSFSEPRWSGCLVISSLNPKPSIQSVKTRDWFCQSIIFHTFFVIFFWKKTQKFWFRNGHGRRWPKTKHGECSRGFGSGLRRPPIVVSLLSWSDLSSLTFPVFTCSTLKGHVMGKFIMNKCKFLAMFRFSTVSGSLIDPLLLKLENTLYFTKYFWVHTRYWDPFQLLSTMVQMLGLVIRGR